MSNDSWRTSDELFNVLDKGGEFQGIPFDGFNFEIDLCASRENSKCLYYSDEYLNDKYKHSNGENFNCTTIRNFNETRQYSRTHWMNPPYSNPKPFIEKAWDDSRYCRIVCLVKVDTSTKWWGVFWNYYPLTINCYCTENGRYNKGCMDCFGTGNNIVEDIGLKPGADVIYFPKRIKFDPPQELVDSGDVWKVGSKWVQRCKKCCGRATPHNCPYGDDHCITCKGKGYTTLCGPSFASCLIIMDRRGL